MNWKLVCLIVPLTLVSVTSAAQPPILGSWIAHVDNPQDPELSPASICLTFRPDGTFEYLARRETRRFGFVGRYTLDEDRLLLEGPGEDPETVTVRVGPHRLWILAAGEDAAEDSGLPLERTVWCE